MAILELLDAKRSRSRKLYFESVSTFSESTNCVVHVVYMCVCGFFLYNTYIRTCMHACIQFVFIIHVCMHAATHAHTHAHTHTSVIEIRK